MPQYNTKQLHTHDFTHEEVASFKASVPITPEQAMVVPGEGKARELTQHRVQAKLGELRAVAKAGETPTLAPQDRPSGLGIWLPLDLQTLDDWLRPQIPELPPIGSYAVVQPPRNPDVALRVRWEEEAKTA